jgi:hypothetical protein
MFLTISQFSHSIGAYILVLVDVPNVPPWIYIQSLKIDTENKALSLNLFLKNGEGNLTSLSNTPPTLSYIVAIHGYDQIGTIIANWLFCNAILSHYKLGSQQEEVEFKFDSFTQIIP